MPRAKGGAKTHKRRKKVLKMAKGYFGARSKLFRTAVEAVEKGLTYAYRDRKQKKRQFRKLWITRINAAVTSYGLTYSKFMRSLKEINCDLDRKALSNMAIHDADGFGLLVAKAKEISDAHDAKYLTSAAN